MTLCKISTPTISAAAARNGRKPSADTRNSKRREPTRPRGSKRQRLKDCRQARTTSDPRAYRFPISRKVGQDSSEKAASRHEKRRRFRAPNIIQTLHGTGIQLEKYGWSLDKEDAQLCEELQSARRPLPKDSVFSNERFDATHASLKHLNDSVMMEDISKVIVPSAYGTKSWAAVMEHLQEPWVNGIGHAQLMAMPDYSVGISPVAFGRSERGKLFYISKQTDFSYEATGTMYYPFLTAEVDCGSTSLTLAEQQNAYNGAVAVKAVVDLFRVRGELEKVDRKILAFSVSLNSCSWSIYAHFPVIYLGQVKYCRRLILSVNFEANKGQYRWVAYHVIMNIYDMWLPKHIVRLKEAVRGIKVQL